MRNKPVEHLLALTNSRPAPAFRRAGIDRRRPARDTETKIETIHERKDTPA